MKKKKMIKTKKEIMCDTDLFLNMRKNTHNHIRCKKTNQCTNNDIKSSLIVSFAFFLVPINFIKPFSIIERNNFFICLNLMLVFKFFYFCCIVNNKNRKQLCLANSMISFLTCFYSCMYHYFCLSNVFDMVCF